MSLFSDIKNIFSSKKAPTKEESIEEAKTMQTLQNTLSSLHGLPMSLNAVYQSTNDLKSRETELAERLDMYSDAFVRGILDVKIGHALGATDSTSIPYTIKLKDDIEVSDEYRKLLNDEFKYVRDLTLDNVKTIAKDSEALSKGFCVREIKRGKGITKLLHNYTTSIKYINEIKNNRTSTVAFEVAIESKGIKTREVNSRKFVNPDYIGCMNAEPNGYMSLQQENLMQLENMNPFNDQETYYEDFIYGGSFEGVYKHYKKYQWALEALFNARVSSSIIERFIIHNLDGLGAEEVKALKESLLKQIKSAGEKLKEKVATLDPTANTLNTYIPTIGDVNSVRVEESDRNYNLSVDDILMHIKTFIGAIGYNLALTSYGDNQRGGEEEDGVENKSLIMDAQSDRIRDSVTKFLKDTCRVHLKYKYLDSLPVELDTNVIEVSYVSVTNKSQLVAETQRLQAINNNQQVGTILEQFKGLMLNDNEGTRKYLKSMLRGVMPQNMEELDSIIESHIEYILTKPKQEDEEM